MKKMLLLFVVLLLHLGVRAQFGGNITVINNTPCKIYVDLLVSVPGSPCSSQQYATGPILQAPGAVNVYPMATPPVVVGSPLPVPPGSRWQVARVYDGCGAVTVGNPACFTPSAILNSCCNAYPVVWDPFTATLKIN